MGHIGTVMEIVVTVNFGTVTIICAKRVVSRKMVSLRPVFPFLVLHSLFVPTEVGSIFCMEIIVFARFEPLVRDSSQPNWFVPVSVVAKT